jgi:hypothetical protein
MRIIPVLLAIIPILTSCAQNEQEAHTQPSEEAIITVLDEWHAAAANANFDSYFNYFKDDSSVFMGTDATERWTIAEFKPWAKPYFDQGKAWSFTGHSRHIYFNDNGTIAWFDEELDTPNLGPSRGTGVLEKVGEDWKIVHYNLTIPIPNDLVDRVVQQIDSLGKGS